jgi:hypothetical protein
MKTVGKRKQQAITYAASGTLLAEGARFNDEMHGLPTGAATFLPKGVYFFKRHEDANRQQQDCLTRGMALIARQRRSDGTV